MKLTAFKWSSLLSASALTILCLGGCADKNNNGQPDTISQPAVNKTVSEVKNAATKAVDSAEVVAANSATTARIKGAFVTDAILKARTIDVTTDTTKKTVRLDGTVQTAAQKTQASKIAQRNAPAGFKIINNLKVAAGASPGATRKTNNKAAAKKNQ